MVITMIDTQYKIKSKKFDIFPLINSVIMILFVIITLYPVLNTLAISLNDGTDALRGGIYLWPRKFTQYLTKLQNIVLILFIVVIFFFNDCQSNRSILPYFLFELP